MKYSDTAKITRAYLNGMLINWIVICAAIILPIILAPFISRQWSPMVRLFEIFVLIAYIQSNRMRSKPICMRSVYVMISVMIVTAVITLGFNLSHVHWLFGPDSETTSRLHNDALNHLPHIKILITAPVMAIVALFNIWSGRRSAFCLECRSRYAFATDDGFIGHLLRQESAYQIRNIFYIGLFLSIVEWIYYWVFFINVNINTPDNFIFTILPCAILLLSIIYMVKRYMGFWAQYNAICARDNNCDAHTQLRYMVISDGMMLLTDAEKCAIEGTAVDTPAIVNLQNTPNVSEDTARRRFEELSGIKNFSIRYIYRSSGCNAPTTVIHYVVTLDSPSETDGTPIEGSWYNAIHIDRLINNKQTSPQLTAAFKRIYTVTMAWKTYDVDGHRLYPIKNYRPTFRLKDFNDWNVAYDDPQWINVAVNNQDNIMFHLRDFWRNYVRGIGC